MLKSHYLEIIRYLPSNMVSKYADAVIKSVNEFINNQEKGSAKNGVEKDINLTLQLRLQKI